MNLRRNPSARHLNTRVMTVFTVARPGLNYYRRDRTRMGGVILSAWPADRLETFHGTGTFKLLGFYLGVLSRSSSSRQLDSARLGLASLGSASPRRIFFPLFFPRVFLPSFVDVPPGGATVLHATPMRPTVTYNSARYVALGVLAQLSLGIAQAACNQPARVACRHRLRGSV